MDQSFYYILFAYLVPLFLLGGIGFFTFRNDKKFSSRKRKSAK